SAGVRRRGAGKGRDPAHPPERAALAPCLSGARQNREGHAMTNAKPSRILLSTDLSPRCDRAQDRAAQLATEWSAELVALNVLDPAASFDQAMAWLSGAGDEALIEVARHELARDLGDVTVPWQVRVVRHPDTAQAICEQARSVQAGLVVAAVSRNETLGRLLLGSTIEQVARALTVPLLVVR